MKNSKDNSQLLGKPKKYKMYGIFNLKTKRLTYVSLDMEKTSFEYDLEGYGDNNCKIVSFNIILA